MPETQTKQETERELKTVEWGALRVLAEAPAAWAGEIGIQVDFHLSDDDDLAREVVRGLGPGYEIHYAGSTPWLTWGEGPREVAVWVSDDVAGEMDPKRVDWPARRAALASALNEGQPLNVYRDCDPQDPGAVVPTEGDPRQLGVATGFNDEGRLTIEIADGPVRSYPSVDALLTDGWIPD